MKEYQSDEELDDVRLLDISMKRKVLKYAKKQYSKNTKLALLILMFLILMCIIIPTVLLNKKIVEVKKTEMIKVPEVSVVVEDTKEEDVNGNFTIATSFNNSIPGKKAFVTMLVPTNLDANKYFSALLLWIINIRYFNPTSDVIVLTTNDVPKGMLDVLSSMKVDYRMVPKLESEGVPIFYKPMLTKLALWSLVQYSQVAYYDSDHVYMQSPEVVFDDCGNHPFCGCQDIGSVGLNRSYLNAGFMVIQPNLTMFNYLKNKSYLADGKLFAEQDLINIIFKGKWKLLDERHSLMFPNSENIKKPGIVSIHQKYWNFKDIGLDDPELIWNKLKANFTFTSSFDFAFPYK